MTMKRNLRLRKSSQGVKPLRTVIEGELEIVTPLHIGSGEELCGADFLTAYGTFTRIDERKLFARFAGDADALTALEAPALDLDDFLYTRGIPPSEIASYTMKMATRRQPKRENRALEFARGGVDRRPYLPGSSLKGSLVSGLLWMINATSRDENNPLWVSQRFRELLAQCRYGRFPTDTALLESLLGREAHNRIGRVIHVPDVSIPADAVQLHHASLFHLHTPSGGYHWSSDRGGETRDSRQATPIFVEAVAAGRKLPVRISFDEFLVREARRKHSPINFPAESLEAEWMSPEFILSGMNDLAYNTIWVEKNYFERARDERLAARYAELFRRCENLAGNEVMFRTGWGLNWHGVTGYLWDDPTAKDLSLPTRRHTQFPFPKTRRIIFDMENPLGTPGWMILRITGQHHEPHDAPAIASTSAAE